MFTIGSMFRDSHFYIHNGLTDRHMYLHCDGRVINVCEYFESYAAAKKVLDKYYPKPEHVWKHGDVFNSGGEWPKIYIKVYGQQPRVFHLRGASNGEGMVTCGCLNEHLNNATFLFNIREKL